MLGRKGRETVSIPVPNIDIPHFRHGKKGSGGTGQGEGEVGQPIGRGQDDGDGQGQAGSEPGAHIGAVEVSLEELAQMLGEELELPNIEPKGKDAIRSKKDKYTTIGRTGPDSLRHFKRTYKEALKRQIRLNDVIALALEPGAPAGLGTLPGVASVHAGPDGAVELTVDSAEKRLPEVLRFVHEQGALVRSCEVREPELEEVFVELAR